MRLRSAFVIAAFHVFVFTGCKGKDSGSDDDVGFLANASAEAKDALSTPVEFQLTEENFAKWEMAERILDQIPQSQFASANASGANAIDRAVARLEASPRAKRAIEAAGMTVRDFVLETVALAQAVQASQTGRSTVASGVAAENFAFVERYRQRIRDAGLASELARQSGDTAITDPNTAAELVAANADRIADSVAAAADSAMGIDKNPREGRPPRDSARDTTIDSLSARRR